MKPSITYKGTGGRKTIFMNISLIGGDGRGDEICYISFSLAREYFGKQAFIQQNQNCVSFKQCTWLPHLNQLSSDENDMLLIGSLSLSGVLLLLLVLQTIGVICFVRKNRSRKNAVKKDVNPLYDVVSDSEHKAVPLC